MTDRPGNASPAISKCATGIHGFDQITHGGLPEGRTTLLLGAPGCGKTIFALQTLVNGAKAERVPGIFVAFEEPSEQIVANAATFGWDLEELTRDRLFFLDAYLSPLTPASGEYELTGILAALKAKAEEMKAHRIVFDGIDVMLGLLGDPLLQRREIYRLHEWLTENGFTGIITAKIDGPSAEENQRYGFMQFMANTVVILHHRLAERVSLRGVRVTKYRGSSFSANEYPLVITPHGIEVTSFGQYELEAEVSTERVSTGVPRLDTMLEGGYYRGSSTLITGSPGTSKTTLCGAFAAAAAARGEKTVFVSFDEPGSQIVRNLASVSIDLARHRDSGMLVMYSARTEARSAEEHLAALTALMRREQPTCLVIDPISAFAKSGGQIAAVDAALRLLDYAKANGITTVCSSLTDSPDALTEATSLQISTIADTWIHVSYVISGGERNRAVSIVKSRGTGHSNQVRELILTHRGVTLADVYRVGGDVVMGTARFEREAKEQAEVQEEQMEAARRRQELEEAEAQARAQIESLQRSLTTTRANLERLSEAEAVRNQEHARRERERRRLRHADAEAADPGDVGTGD